MQIPTNQNEIISEIPAVVHVTSIILDLDIIPPYYLLIGNFYLHDNNKNIQKKWWEQNWFFLLTRAFLIKLSHFIGVYNRILYFKNYDVIYTTNRSWLDNQWRSKSTGQPFCSSTTPPSTVHTPMSTLGIKPGKFTFRC